jgi:hypothetical protein
MILGGEILRRNVFRISYCLPWGANSSPYAAVFGMESAFTQSLLRVELLERLSGNMDKKHLVVFAVRRGWKRLENLIPLSLFKYIRSALAISSSRCHDPRTGFIIFIFTLDHESDEHFLDQLESERPFCWQISFVGGAWLSSTLYYQVHVFSSGVDSVPLSNQ